MDAIIFDLDGTLLDSEPWHKKAEIEAFKTFGIEIGETDLIPFVGTTLPHMLGGIAPNLTVDEFLAVEQPILAGYIAEQMEAFADAERLVDRLKFPLALATSSMRWYVDATTQRFPWLESRFTVRRCQADITKGKPDPEIFLQVCEALGFEPGRCLVIEDSPNGVAAGRAAGCKVVGVQRHPELDLSAAHEVVSDLDRLWFV